MLEIAHCPLILAKPLRILKTKTTITKLAKYRAFSYEDLSKTLPFWLEGQVLINNDQSLIEFIKKPSKNL